MKAHIVSLGCPKNLTDTEVLMGKLVSQGYALTADPAEAETIVVNTCAFLKTARDESAAVISEMAKWKKKGRCRKLYVAGCLPRFRTRNTGMFKNVDGIIDSVGLFNHCTPRVKATHPWYAYVKIAEGCNNRCSYCLIPGLRGKLRVRPVADILKEVKLLAKRGVKEIIYVAQDTTAHPDFASILAKTAKIRGVRWIRIMYAHPEHISDKILDLMAKEKKIIKVLDLPIQHGCDKILMRMNRRYKRQDLENLILKIRRRKLALRTTVIVGFPGENEAGFEELLGFIRQVKFERLGCFAYQKEKGTPASKMRGQVSAKVKQARFQKLMRAQARIAGELNHKLIGKKMEIIIERAVRGGFIGRCCLDAPEIDGSVLVKSPKKLTPGEIVRARISGAKAYDLFGCLT